MPPAPPRIPPPRSSAISSRLPSFTHEAQKAHCPILPFLDIHCCTPALSVSTLPLSHSHTPYIGSLLLDMDPLRCLEGTRPHAAVQRTEETCTLPWREQLFMPQHVVLSSLYSKWESDSYMWECACANMPLRKRDHCIGVCIGYASGYASSDHPFCQTRRAGFGRTPICCSLQTRAAIKPTMQICDHF